LNIAHKGKRQGWALKGIDVFSGAGGMSVGAEWAGIETVVAIDSNAQATKTYATNHPSTKVICEDIRAVSFSNMRPKGACVLFGGPPCQGFSTSNQRTRNSMNSANWLFKEFLRAVGEIDPDWVIFENVKGITETEGAMFLEQVICGLQTLGFSVRSMVLNARDFGVPQNRSRLFVVAARDMSNFSTPQPDQLAPVTVRDAISDLPILENGASFEKLNYSAKPVSNFARRMRQHNSSCSNNHVTENSKLVVERYRHIPEGGNWKDIPSELMQNYKDATRCHTGIYKRLEWSKPAVTIGNYRKNMLVHPAQNRGLSVREAARLQSFPDSYQFAGSIGFQQQQVGNAVPPLLALAVFKAIVAAASTIETSPLAEE
jgi:DNA (cytosine-5)-methyltransferase 1